MHLEEHHQNRRPRISGINAKEKKSTVQENILAIYPVKEFLYWSKPCRLQLARRTRQRNFRNDICPFSAIIENDDDLLDDCAVPNYSAKHILVLPLYSSYYSDILQQFKELFSVKTGARTQPIMRYQRATTRQSEYRP
ncbi:hypothetical protein M514_08398 [Trichuris suis]|uniref:Uncharacterized protein n=1 Tax=Trichuris suis TaxID=68888 RepID=A0A085M0J6_9BILA|nr:hypothetical protein M513_08398 [Trichuris suis]KFD63148.1 hypothetical protein M514_08398 [Trichuris suis]